MLGCVHLFAGKERVIAWLCSSEDTVRVVGLRLFSEDQDHFALDVDSSVVVVLDRVVVGGDAISGEDQRSIEVTVSTERKRLELIAER